MKTLIFCQFLQVFPYQVRVISKRLQEKTKKGDFIPKTAVDRDRM